MITSHSHYFSEYVDFLYEVNFKLNEMLFEVYWEKRKRGT